MATVTRDNLKHIRALAQKDLFFFAQGILGYEWLNPRVHRPICQRLQDTKKRRVNVTMPRNFYKSVLATISYPLWRAINNPEITILIAMNRIDNASTKLRELQQHVESNSLFRALFPEVIPDFAHVPWGEKRATLRRTLSFGTPTFTVAGAGTKVISQHYDEIIMDDLVTAGKDDVSGGEILPKVQDIDEAINWYRQAIALLRDPREGRILNVGTRWAEKDLVEYILRNKEFAENNYSIKAAETWPDGPATFPERYPMELLREIESMTGSTIFRLWYLNEPIDPHEIVFNLKEEHFYAPGPVEAKLNALPHYTAVDLSVGATAQSDNTAIVTVAVDENNTRWVRDVKYGKFTPDILIDLLFATYDQYKPRVMGIESVAYQAFLPRVMQHFMRERDCPLPLREIKRGGKVSKQTRILAVQPFLQSGMLMIPNGCRDLETEMRDFRLDAKRSGHDDALDALADAVRLSQAQVKVEAAKQERRITTDEEWEAFYKKFYDVNEAAKRLIDGADTDERAGFNHLDPKLHYLHSAN